MIIRPCSADTLVAPSAPDLASPAPKGRPTYDPFLLIHDPARARVIPQGYLEDRCRRNVHALLDWGEVLAALRDPALRHRLMGGSFSRFVRKFLGFAHHAIAARVVELSKVIERAAREASYITGVDPAWAIDALEPPLLGAMLDMRSDYDWAWLQRRKLIDAVLLGLLDVRDAALCLRRSIARATRIGRGAGARVKWSVQLRDGRYLSQSTWARP